jgi:hypothetical protein
MNSSSQTSPATAPFFSPQKIIGAIAGLAFLCLFGATCLIAITAWVVVSRANDERQELEKQMTILKSDFASFSDAAQSERSAFESKLAIATKNEAATAAKLASLNIQLAKAKAGALAANQEVATLKKEIAKNGVAAAPEKKPAITNPLVTRENYKKINLGMTLKDVEKILGPGVESSRSTSSVHMYWRSGTGAGATAINITFRFILFQEMVVDYAGVTGK